MLPWSGPHRRDKVTVLDRILDVWDAVIAHWMDICLWLIVGLVFLAYALWVCGWLYVIFKGG